MVLYFFELVYFRRHANERKRNYRRVTKRRKYHNDVSFLEVDRVTSARGILDDVEIVRRKSKRPQNHVPELLQVI